MSSVFLSFWLSYSNQQNSRSKWIAELYFFFLLKYTNYKKTRVFFTTFTEGKVEFALWEIFSFDGNLQYQNQY